MKGNISKIVIGNIFNFNGDRVVFIDCLVCKSNVIIIVVIVIVVFVSYSKSIIIKVKIIGVIFDIVSCLGCG